MDPYVGEIRFFAGSFAPVGWALCDGTVLAISQNEALYTLIGTTYGGDGVNTFALPDLRGRIPVHRGNNYPMGMRGGSETVTLTSNQLPAHAHAALAHSTEGTSADPTGNFWGYSANEQYVTADTINGTMSPTSVSVTGGSQPHDNMMPYLAVNFIIALEGIYPQQN